MLGARTKAEKTVVFLMWLFDHTTAKDSDRVLWSGGGTERQRGRELWSLESFAYSFSTLSCPIRLLIYLPIQKVRKKFKYMMMMMMMTMAVFVYVCVRVCVCACVYVCMYLCMYLFMYVCMYVCMCMRV